MNFVGKKFHQVWKYLPLDIFLQIKGGGEFWEKYTHEKILNSKGWITPIVTIVC